MVPRTGVTWTFRATANRAVPPSVPAFPDLIQIGLHFPIKSDLRAVAEVDYMMRSILASQLTSLGQSILTSINNRTSKTYTLVTTFQEQQTIT